MSGHHTRVAALFRHYHPVLTGSGERFRRYAPGLAQRNITIDIHTSQVNGAPIFEDGSPVIYRYPTGQASTTKMDVALLKAARLLYAGSPETPIVFQVISASRPLLMQLLLWKLAGNIRVVFVGTMVEPLTPPKGPIGKLKRRCLNLLFRHCIDHIIVGSSIMAQIYLDNGISEKRISVIPNGVDTKRFSPVESPTEKLALRDQLGIAAAERVTLFVGNLIPRKGIDLLLEAWSILVKNPEHSRDVLVVIGPKERPTFVGQSQQQILHDFQIHLDNLVSRIPERNIKFFDPVENIEQFFKAADLFAFPSLKEGMGNVVMEAMACSLPVATTPFHGFPKSEFGQEGTEYLKLDFDPSVMARQLSGALLNQEHLTRIGNNARTWSVNNLGLEATLDQFAEVYHDIANRH